MLSWRSDIKQSVTFYSGNLDLVTRTWHISLVQLLHRLQACKSHKDRGCMFDLAEALPPLGAICRARLCCSPGNPHVSHAAGKRSSFLTTG